MQKAFASPSCKRVGKKERKAIAKPFTLHRKTKRETGLLKLTKLDVTSDMDLLILLCWDCCNPIGKTSQTFLKIKLLRKQILVQEIQH